MIKFINNEEKYKNTKIKIARWVFTVLLICIGCLSYWVFFDENPFLKNTSPNQRSLVEITEYGNGFLFGSKNIKVYFKDAQGNTVQEEKIRVENIMEPNNKSLYDITWEDENRVKITMDYEGETKTLTYNFNTKRMKISTK
ncbi:hypothetical protein [Priestia endophytica]|uniref:hypothetical protein n=1 Tax=Priestia endophytica TaxID=135735 RepID=UPI00203C525D|nr:hypothetical protein [Priestia endophytica]MCM3541091.1 hypothetical protein [Priestia endophytica]